MPLLTERHQKALLLFQKVCASKPKSFWESVLWTDEHPKKAEIKALEGSEVTSNESGSEFY